MSLYLDIKITEDTNTKEQKTKYIQKVFDDMSSVIGKLNPISYIVIDDGKACPATYFFRSVFCDGEIKIVEDYDEKVKGLELLMQKLQPEGKYIPLNDEMYKKMINATEVFRFDIKQMTCKVKLGQNLSQKRYEKILEHLELRGNDMDKLTVKMMKESL